MSQQPIDPDQLDIFDALPDGRPMVDVVAVEANRPSGHIALGRPDTAADVTLVDEGPCLAMWGWGVTSVRLTPAAARNLAAELTRWADRKEPQP